MISQSTFTVETNGRGIYEVSRQVASATTASGIQTGLANIFIHHTSASLFINENADPSVRTDLESFLSRLVPDGDPIYTHTFEGPDDMAAHVRTLLTSVSLNVPVTGGALGLGTWQGIFLWEHRARPHHRRITVTING